MSQNILNIPDSPMTELASNTEAANLSQTPFKSTYAELTFFIDGARSSQVRGVAAHSNGAIEAGSRF